MEWHYVCCYNLNFVNMYFGVGTSGIGNVVIPLHCHIWICAKVHNQNFLHDLFFFGQNMLKFCAFCKQSTKHNINYLCVFGICH